MLSLPALRTVITKKLPIPEDAMIPLSAGQGHTAAAVADGSSATPIGKENFSRNPRHADYSCHALLAVNAEAGGAVADDR